MLNKAIYVRFISIKIVFCEPINSEGICRKTFLRRIPLLLIEISRYNPQFDPIRIDSLPLNTLIKTKGINFTGYLEKELQFKIRIRQKEILFNFRK